MAFKLNGAAIAWGSKLQGSVALSSTEAEYIAMAWAAQEGTHLRQLLVDLGQHTSMTRPTELAGDNQGSLFLAQNTTSDQVADAFTKPLPAPVFIKHRDALLRGTTIQT